VLTPLEAAQLEAQTNEWLRKRVVEKTGQLPWVNNPVFVLKKNGTVRTCIDCRPANAVTKEYEWPLPKLQELRHRLAGARWFTRIDLKDAFFRIGVPHEFRHLTAYKSMGQNYWFRKMPFGLKTAPSTYQRFMDHSLAEVGQICLWYIDDILVFAPTKSQLHIRVQRVEKALSRARTEVNHDKTERDKQGLLFGGLWVYPKGLGPNYEKVRALLATPQPRTKKEMQSALGLVSYLRDFLPLLAHFTAALYPGKGTLLEGPAYAGQWNKLLDHTARCICTISHWNEQENAQLYTDASGAAVAAVLIQNGRIVTVASRKLKGAEVRYSTTDREHLSLLLAAERFKVFLHRPRGTTEVFNDHAALMNRKTKNMTPRQERWHYRIGQWIRNVTHVPGIKNPAKTNTPAMAIVQTRVLCLLRKEKARNPES
jgi:hypothetical protein